MDFEMKGDGNYMHRESLLEGLIDKMIVGFSLSVFAGVIAWVTLVKFVTHVYRTERGGEG